jgi:hypothetical protein
MITIGKRGCIAPAFYSSNGNNGFWLLWWQELLVTSAEYAIGDHMADIDSPSFFCSSLTPDLLAMPVFLAVLTVQIL